MQDLVKWSLKDENRAIQDALTQVGELFSIWNEVQRELNDHIKEFKHQFDMILEGAKQLDMAKTDLQTAEQKEGKIKKELKKGAKKATAEELREMTARLSEAEREKDIAQLEVVDRVREHEAVKMIRIKEGLFKVSEAYVDYAQKCDVIFCAQRDIALQIPDIEDKDIQDIKYTGQWLNFLLISCILVLPGSEFQYTLLYPSYYSDILLSLVSSLHTLFKIFKILKFRTWQFCIFPFTCIYCTSYSFVSEL